MSEKENKKPNEQETPPQTSHVKKQQGRYSMRRTKKKLRSSMRPKQGQSEEKNKDDNSNLHPTEDKTSSSGFAAYI